MRCKCELLFWADDALARPKSVIGSERPEQGGKGEC